MMLVYFVTDFDEVEVPRGAEFNGAALRERLSKRGITFEVVKSKDFVFSPGRIHLLGNRHQANEVELKKLASDGRFVLFEHDFGFIPGRVMREEYKDQMVPKTHQRLRYLYDQASSVICLSEVQRKIFEKNLGRVVLSCGASFFSQRDLDLMREISRRRKTKKTAIIQSKNVSKGTSLSFSFCERNGIDFEVLKPQGTRSLFLQALGCFESLVFHTLYKESWCRLVVEARMMGLKVITNDLASVVSEEWWSRDELVGERLIDFYEDVLLPKAEEMFLSSLYSPR